MTTAMAFGELGILILEDARLRERLAREEGSQ